MDITKVNQSKSITISPIKHIYIHIAACIPAVAPSRAINNTIHQEEACSKVRASIVATSRGKVRQEKAASNHPANISNNQDSIKALSMAQGTQVVEEVV